MEDLLMPGWRLDESRWHVTLSDEVNAQSVAAGRIHGPCTDDHAWGPTNLKVPRVCQHASMFCRCVQL